MKRILKIQCWTCETRDNNIYTRDMYKEKYFASEFMTAGWLVNSWILCKDVVLVKQVISLVDTKQYS